jgi:hypothetical protein
MKDRPLILRLLQGLEHAVDSAVAESKISYELRADSYSFGCVRACLVARTALFAYQDQQQSSG